MKGFSCHLTEISTPILLANLIEIPSNSLFISSRITRCQILDIKFFEEQEQYFFFFRVNLQLLKLQLPLHRDRGGGGAGRAVALPLLLLGFII